MNQDTDLALAQQCNLIGMRPHLDGIYEKSLLEFAAKVRAEERNKLAAWMIQFGYATGHGDTMEELLDALGTEIVDHIEFEVDSEREACAKVCDAVQKRNEDDGAFMWEAKNCATAIRARGDS